MSTLHGASYAELLVRAKMAGGNPTDGIPQPAIDAWNRVDRAGRAMSKADAVYQAALAERERVVAQARIDAAEVASILRAEVVAAERNLEEKKAAFTRALEESNAARDRYLKDVRAEDDLDQSRAALADAQNSVDLAAKRLETAKTRATKAEDVEAGVIVAAKPKPPQPVRDPDEGFVSIGGRRGPQALEQRGDVDELIA